MPKIIIPIRGMHCRSCELIIENELKTVTGIKKVNVSQKNGQAEIFFKDTMPDSEIIREKIKNAGYDIGIKNKAPWISKDWGDYKNLFIGAGILLVIYLLISKLGLLELGVNTESTGVAVALVVGLVAGVSTCMAMIGGLILSISARHAELHPEATAKQKFRPHLYFNLWRISSSPLE